LLQLQVRDEQIQTRVSFVISARECKIKFEELPDEATIALRKRPTTAEIFKSEVYPLITSADS
jgi:hypothetical protein